MAEPDLSPLLQGTAGVIAEDELRQRVAAGRPLRVKLGLDPTASDLHLGHAVVLRTLRRFQDAGHKAVLIVGDFTAMVGDPSGRSVTRPRLTREQVDAAAETYLTQVTTVLDPDPQRLEVRRNSEWLATMGIDDVLNLAARTTVARMLERNDFANRYEAGQPISVSEFLYPLLQGWDSVMVRADVELGGTDQLFNLLVGRQLQQQEDTFPQVVVTTPLLVGLSGPDADGPKMSKSLGNYVGLSEPAETQFGKLMSIPDSLLETYAQHATGWAQPEVDGFVAALRDGSLHPNAAKRQIAAAVADLYHGTGAGAGAEAEFDRVHKRHEIPSDVPDCSLAAKGVGAGDEVALARVLTLTELAASGREAARRIEEGAVRIDGEVVRENVSRTAIAWTGIVLQVGRRKWVRLV
ncbi:MAG TPA: tyrosine--tRNA ligase [Acidimicrobiia bacterium]